MSRKAAARDKRDRFTAEPSPELLAVLVSRPHNNGTKGCAMGMFDDVRCKYPLPVAGANELDYQTKFADFPNLDQYEIREDGTVWVEQYDVEDHSDPNAEGLMAIVGCMTRVNKRMVPFVYTGPMEFYTSVGDDWLEFCALFEAGALKSLVVVSQPANV